MLLFLCVLGIAAVLAQDIKVKQETETKFISKDTTSLGKLAVGNRTRDILSKNNKFMALKIFQDSMKEEPMLNIIQYTSSQYQPGMLTGVSTVTGESDMTWVYKQGPMRDGRYQYLVVSNFLRYPVTVLVRDPDQFKKEQYMEVMEWLGQQKFPTQFLYRPEYESCSYPPQVFEYVAKQAAMFRLMGRF